MKILWIALWIQAQLVIFTSGNDGLLEEGNGLSEIHSTIDIPIEVCPGADVTKVTPGTEFLCPGAPESSYFGGQLRCLEPDCTNKFESTLGHPTKNPTKYSVCDTNGNHHEMSCAPGTCFSFDRQTCVHPQEWQNPCSNAVEETDPELPIVVCPGADLTKVTPGTENCEVPICDATLATTKFKSPSASPTQYYDCLSATIVRKNNCPPGQCFNYKTQICVNPSEWENPCYYQLAPKEPIQTCPGVDIETLTPGDQNCDVQECSQQLYSAKAILPMADPTKYYDCLTAKIMRISSCAPGRCFNFNLKKCVEPKDWVNACYFIPPTTTTSTSTTSTTTSTTTTPTTSTSSSTSTTTTTTTTTEPTTTTPPTTLPTVCPGSDPSQLTPGTQSCIEPTCNQELYNSKVKMTHANPQKYYDCISAAYLRTMNCVSGRCFDYSSQSCVEPVDWHNSCIY